MCKCLSCGFPQLVSKVCCDTSWLSSVERGCWPLASTDAGLAFNWETCCRNFIIWRPHGESPTSLAYETILHHILDSKNQHEGMIFGRLAAELGYGRCVEVGVLSALWSRWFLESFTTFERGVPGITAERILEYTLVDLWIGGQRNYVDDVASLSMVDNFETALQRVKQFWPWVRFVQEPSNIAARLFDNASLDFVFIDARHDECAVKEDLETWWPKIRAGGLLAGDDYVDAVTGKEMYEWNNWSICENGEVRPGAVRGAVNTFFRTKGLHVSSFRFRSLSPQWLVFKP